MNSPRYMHQTVIVKGTGSKWHLLAIGGKKELGGSGWLNSVESLDLTLFLQPHLRKGEDKKKPVFELVSW